MSSYLRSAWTFVLLLVVVSSVMNTNNGNVGIVVVTAQSSSSNKCPKLEAALPSQVVCPTCVPSVDIKNGYKVKLDCTIPTSICFKIIKGASTCIEQLLFGGKYYQKNTPSQSYFSGAINKVRIPYTTNSTSSTPKKRYQTIPNQTLAITATHEVPFNLSAPYKFTNCSVVLNNQTCTDCSICDNGSVQFDCTNVVYATLNNGTEITFPKYTKCIGLPYNKTV